MSPDFKKGLKRSEIGHFSPPDVEEGSKKAAPFFVPFLGGPPLYLQKYGPPRMRARHLPFEIDEASRQVWLACFEKTLEGADVKYQFPPQHLEGFKDFLKGFSAWMVNKA